MAPPPVLLTRPEQAGRRFAHLLRDMGWPGRILFSPVIEIVPQAPLALPGGTLVLTSENAVRAVAHLAGGRLALALSGRTAIAARAAGLRVIPAGGDAAALGETALARPDLAPFVHVRGVHVAGDLAGRLRAAKLAACEVVAYDQVRQGLRPGARAALAGPVIAPLFSARSARLLAGALPPGGPAPRAVVPSPAVAAAWGLPGTLAERPDAAAMAAAVCALVGVGGER